jgi:uncharacterized membrane protein
MTRDFAPISRDQSVQIRLASVWLILNGALFLAGLAVVLVSEVLGSGETVLLSHPFSTAFAGLLAGAMLQTGRGLGRRSIFAGYAGLAVYGLPLLLGMLFGGLTLEAVIVGGMGVLAIALAWNYLEPQSMDFSETIAIAAPHSTVWSVISDGERWPEWTPSVTSVKLLDPAPLALGSRVRIKQPRLPPALWRLTEWEEGRAFTWVNKAPGVLVSARHSVEPDGPGSSATLAITFEGPLGPLVGRLTRNLNVSYLNLEAWGLKTRSESLLHGETLWP